VRLQYCFCSNIFWGFVQDPNKTGDMVHQEDDLTRRTHNQAMVEAAEVVTADGEILCTILQEVEQDKRRTDREQMQIERRLE